MIVLFPKSDKINQSLFFSKNLEKEKKKVSFQV